MQPFMMLDSIAAPLAIANVDTDKIIPARFMKTITREGLGAHLFDALRYEDGVERADFVLNRGIYRNAKILITLDNFGCGSSREHAVWALLDFGIRCIIAPSFADIFFANCYKNGILPVRLPSGTVAGLLEEAEQGARFIIDLSRQIVIRPNGEELAFEIDAFRKALLLSGEDEIGLTLQHADEIAAFEQRRAPMAWLFPAVDRPVREDM